MLGRTATRVLSMLKYARSSHCKQQEAMYNVDVDIDTALAGVWHFWLHYHLISRTVRQFNCAPTGVQAIQTQRE